MQRRCNWGHQREVTELEEETRNPAPSHTYVLTMHLPDFNPENGVKMAGRAVLPRDMGVFIRLPCRVLVP